MSIHKMYKCECHCESLTVDIDPSEKIVDFSFWTLGSVGVALGWRDRIILIWKIIRTGTSYDDMVILDFPTANQMAHDIIKATEPKKWINKEVL